MPVTWSGAASTARADHARTRSGSTTARDATDSRARYHCDFSDDVEQYACVRSGGVLAANESVTVELLHHGAVKLHYPMVGESDDGDHIVVEGPYAEPEAREVFSTMIRSVDPLLNAAPDGFQGLLR
jgi:hypothetical protein